MKSIIFMIIAFALSSSGLASGPVVIKSKPSDRLRRVILEIDDNPYSAPELILGASGVTVVIFPGVVEQCEIAFNGYDYRKGRINKRAEGVFQEVVFRYDLSKISAEARSKLTTHRFEVVCSYEYNGKSKYVEFDTVFNDEKRYTLAWLRHKNEALKDSINIDNFNGFQFVTMAADGSLSLEGSSIETAFERKAPVTEKKPAPPKKSGMEKFKGVTIENGKVTLED